MCCNGFKRAVPALHAVASTWSSCVELPVQSLFLGISAALNLTIYGGDATDAYAHASASEIPTYLKVDEAYEEWWNETAKLRDKPKINRKYVLPIEHYLQGSPENPASNGCIL